MGASLLSRILRAVCRLLIALLLAVFLCLMLLLAADILRCVGGLFSRSGGDTVLTLGKWRFIFREEILSVFRAKWDLLCTAAKHAIPSPLPEIAGEWTELVVRAFSRQ